MLKKWIETNSDGIITNFWNNEKEGLTAVQIPDEWNEPFCTRTTDFKLVQDENGINVVKPKNTLIIATWNEFNTVKPKMEELQKKNEELQTILDASDEKLSETTNKITQLQQMITFMNNQGGVANE